MQELANKNVLVLGLGDTGFSAVRWLKKQGAWVMVADTRDSPPQRPALARDFPEVPLFTGPLREENFSGAELLVVSPGVPLSDPMVRAFRGRGVPVLGDVELFARALDRAPGTRVVAITGSNGKSTVTSMTSAMCAAAGCTTVAAGNIGLPVLQALFEIESGEEQVWPDIFVLELSSFQLEATASLNAFAATVLNMSEDHMDRYRDMQEYAQAKSRVFRGAGIQVINKDDALSRAMELPGRRVVRFGLSAPAREDEYGILETGGRQWLARGARGLMPMAELPLVGMHNAANALAALALCAALGLQEEPLLDALKRFQGLSHRMQKIAEISGVAFYDDSKGTNVGATVAALNGMTVKVVLIAGGDGKGQDFSPLKPALAKHARALVLIGRDGDRIAAAVAGAGVPTGYAQDMDQAVELAAAAAMPGDAVLLSPACASFDMFRNYEHRAEVFVRAVKKLTPRTAGN